MSAHDLETECFFVTPIGEAGSDIRRQSDQVSRHIVGPAAEHVRLRVLRADELAEPGQISHQVIEHVCNSAAVVADLTGSNANVYYELALRHAVKKPLVLIAHEEHMPKLAFDVAAERVIPYSHTDLDRVAEVIEELKKQLRSALDGPVKSPVSIALNLGALEGGDPGQQVLADLSGRMDGMAQAVRDLSARIPMSGEEMLRLKFAARRADGKQLVFIDTDGQPLGEMPDRPLSFGEEAARIRERRAGLEIGGEPEQPTAD